MKHKRYSVLQGIGHKSGDGDMHTIGEFNTLEEAYNLFEDIKNDVNGWAYKGTITTQILDSEADEVMQIVEQHEAASSHIRR